MFDIPTASVAAVPNPNVDLCADASASSSNALPAEVKSYVPALPDPVNCIPLSAADVNPANACSSASSLAFGTVPLAKLEAFNAVRLLPFAATILPLASKKTVLAAGKVQNIVLVPELH